MRWQDQERHLCGGEPDTTNNRMEMTAAIRALNALKRPCKVDLYTDSKYVRDGITQWMANWKKRGWRRADNKPVKNQDLWMELDQALGKHKITWHWVLGHSGVEGNELADQLANRGIDELPKGRGR